MKIITYRDENINNDIFTIDKAISSDVKSTISESIVNIAFDNNNNIAFDIINPSLYYKTYRSLRSSYNIYSSIKFIFLEYT